MPALSPRVWTREEVLALPDDGNRYELVDGELLVSPSPSWLHQGAVLEMAKILDRYCAQCSCGAVALSPADLDLCAAQIVQPDLFVAALINGRRAREWGEVGIPLIVVEVLSPSTADFDRVKKRRRYQQAGVPVYWIVDLDARAVEVWTPKDDQAVIVVQSLTWQPDHAIPALVIDLPAYFASVLDAG